MYVLVQIFTALPSRLPRWRNAQPGQVRSNPPLLAHR
jgi:hypothetical protein